MLAPFRHVTDSRYEWLQNVFIQYLEKWKVSIDSREGFTNGEKNRMFLAQPTYKGLKTTAYSTIEATRYLLNDGMPWVITSRFNQDCAEEDFGRQRSLGGRNDNPTIHQFGTKQIHCVCNGLWWYQQVRYTAYATVCGGTNRSVTLRMQRSVVVPTGNIRFTHNTKRQFSLFNVDETPLQKRATGFQLQ